ncbi:hypothetical protein FE633_40685 [Streptomyces montanus]|uniref:Uncharacterized protein n=1 Tax=Streptomyces montanus TaxID=2580423 RepID=A0A5R9FBU0_9ACTN|nr:hypothetical protein FE633_40685 [Streptomyces montanus]
MGAKSRERLRGPCRAGRSGAAEPFARRRTLRFSPPPPLPVPSLGAAPPDPRSALRPRPRTPDGLGGSGWEGLRPRRRAPPWGTDRSKIISAGQLR